MGMSGTSEGAGLMYPCEDLVCSYCGEPEESCQAAIDGKGATFVSVEEYQRIKESGDYE